MSKSRYYFGFLIRRHPSLDMLVVAATDFGYIVTDKAYGMGRGRKSYDVDCSDPLTFSDEKNGFVVFSKECEAKNELTPQEFNDIMKELKGMVSGNRDDIDLYYIRPDRDNMTPIFKDFNNMYKRLDDFMNKIINVTEFSNIYPIEVNDMDHKHIVVQKTFDLEYYNKGSTYSIRLKDHPIRAKLKDPKSEVVTAVLCDVCAVSTLEFIIVEPPDFSNAARSTRIVLTIDDIEKYDIDIIKNYTIAELHDIVKNITDYYQNKSESIIGKPMKVDIKDIPVKIKDEIIREHTHTDIVRNPRRDDTIIGRRLRDIESSLVNVGEPVDLDDFESSLVDVKDCETNVPPSPSDNIDDVLDNLEHELHINEEIHPLIEKIDNDVVFVEELKKYKGKTAQLDIDMKDEFKFFAEGTNNEHMSNTIVLKNLSSDLKELNYVLKYSEDKETDTIVISEVINTMKKIVLTILD